MFSYSIYNNRTIKARFPNKKVFVDGITPLNGIDYICFGVYFDDKFIATYIKPLYQMKFSVKKILFKNPKNNHCRLAVNIIEYQNGKEIPHIKNVVVDGTFYNVYPDAEFESIGYWKDTGKGKEIFVLAEHSEVLTSSTVAVFNFIKYLVKGKRVSDATIKKIVDKYGIGAIEAIKTLDPGLYKIYKSSSKWTEIQDIFVTNHEEEEAFKYLLSYDISSFVAVKVLEKYHKMSLIEIQKNPYVLLDFADIDFATIDRIAINEGLGYNDENRIIACILYYMQSRIDQNGDIYVEQEEIYGPDPTEESPINEMISKIGLYKEPILNSDVYSAFFILGTTGKILQETKVDDPSKECIYKTYYCKIENYIVDMLKIINTGTATHYVPSMHINSFLKALEKSGTRLDVLQKQAVEMALQNRLSIMTGGPGTGKTQTVKVICDLLLDFNPSADIQLCAPTGKASRRMSEVIGLPAETIHKKLNYMPYSSGMVDLEEIDCDLLIVDETSMLDIDLFYKLLRSISNRTSILLVGDYHQLPSVGPGLILRDVIDSKVVPTTQLKKVFRQASGNDIIDVSRLVLENDTDAILANPKRKHFKFIEKRRNEDALKEILRLTRLIQSKGIPILEFQIITPMNDGLLGTLGLNKEIQAIMNPPDATKPELLVSPIKIFRLGDKVIQTKNNYDLHIFNGSIGIIIEINPAKRTLKVDYDGTVIEYGAEDITELNLAYAITVHKSQGSEFDFVIMPITSNHNVVNNRNLVYTAITRAKKQIALVGNADALKEAIAKQEILHKRSQIKDKLMK